MSEKDKRENKSKITSEQAAKEREARMKKRSEEKKIEAARKAEAAKVAAEERRIRMAKRKEVQLQEQKRKKEIRKQAQIDKAIAGLELVDFSVTARAYQTMLTTKYKSRKFWEDPNPFEIQSYIPGTIISVDVKEGDTVEMGVQVLILEAMKMQNRINMPFTARIKAVHVKPGEKIPKDYVMVELEPVEEE